MTYAWETPCTLNRKQPQVIADKFVKLKAEIESHKTLINIDMINVIY